MFTGHLAHRTTVTKQISDLYGKMAAARKKRAVQDEMEIADKCEDEELENEMEHDSGENDEEDDENCEMDACQSVQVEFEARNMEDPDFHGIKKLLQQVFLKANIDLGQLTDTLISQNYIGSVIKQMDISDASSDGEPDDDDMDVFGVISVLNLTARSALECVRQFKEYLLVHAGRQKDQLQKILETSGGSVGYLMNERFINIPPQIAVPSFQSLWNEVERANKKKMNYKFAFYILISKTFNMKMAKGSAPHKNKQNDAGNRVFVNQEEELFLSESVLTFDYSVESERAAGVSGKWDEEEDEMEPYRTVMVIPAEKVEKIMLNIKSVYGIDSS